MFLLFVFHVFISAICVVTGCLFYSLVPSQHKVSSRPVIFYAFTGLICITLITQVLVLFMPINFLVAILTIAFIIIFSLIQRNKLIPIYKILFFQIRQVSAAQYLAIAAVWIMILLINAGPIMMDDSESYHIQMTKWINEYGTVPGIVNLHERFGFNSSWFSSIAFFFSAGKFVNSYTALNAVISFWFSAFLITKLISTDHRSSIAKSSINIPLLLALVISILCWPMIRGNASTANYDFISTAVIAILFISHFKLEKKESFPYLEWIIWPVYLFTVRIINYPLLLLSLFAIIQLLRKKQWMFATSTIFLSASLLIPFIARNVMVSGYPFYPSTSLDFFPVDWKTDPTIITELRDYIKYYNRVNVMYQEIEVTRQLSFPGWIVSWFQHLFRYDKPIVIAGLGGFFLHFVFISRSLKTYTPAINYFVLVLFLHILSWFFVAPDPRFAHGSLLCGAFLLSQMPGKLNQLAGNIVKPSYPLIVFSILVLSYTGMKFIKQKYYHYAITPLALPKPPVREIKVDSIIVRIPEKVLNNWNQRCYATDLPCLYIIRPGLQMRGKTIQSGFRLEK